MDFCRARLVYFGALNSLADTGKNPAEVWAYVNAKTYRQDRYGSWELAAEINEPVTHWENVIGRATSATLRQRTRRFPETTGS